MGDDSHAGALRIQRGRGVMGTPEVYVNVNRMRWPTRGFPPRW